MKEPCSIIDISQPVTKSTACFPGDTSFDYSLKASHANTGSYNVTAFRMSPHVGTHADAPAHVLETMDQDNLIGGLPLTPFIGPCRVMDLCPCKGEIGIGDIGTKLALDGISSRILFRTRCQSAFDVFHEESAYLSREVVEFLNGKGVRLIGMDTSSVDPVHSKTLEAHHALIAHGMVWLENLDLTAVREGTYFLSALPVKFMELEAAPVRAVLMAFESGQKGRLPC